MHFAVLTHAYFPVVGGAEIGIHEIYDRIGAAHDVTIVTSLSADYSDDFVADDDRSIGTYRVLRYKGRRLWGLDGRWEKFKLLVGWREFRVIRALHRQQRLDAVNIHFAAPYGMAALWIQLFLRVPVVISLVGRSDVYADLGTWDRRHLRAVMRVATKTVQNSPYYLDKMPGGESVEVVPYGANLHDFTVGSGEGPVSQAPVVLVTFQRLSPVKRVDVLLDVAAELERRHPGRFVLRVFGKGSEGAALESKISTEKIVNAELLGYVSDERLADELRNAHVFVAHTMSETFGVMFVQAMAAGLPIVAASTSSIPYVVDSDTNGELVPPFDVPGFADAVERQVVPERWATVSRANRARAEKEFDWDVIARRMKTIMEGR
ncbi:glycosyltransferase family 4 protein [Salinibacterium sp. G-O1]|uniref:glycosyltransferase family 4 protein n=1 Tax=Salinibacterium sp. G-O1 TaxID=3046208 RepID=UPI0024BA4B55|nr:glycosyltransferase family 4 protein [Salinibacterium sp. G-O1]MDJ0336532.1 glycosyltransferase family 4 protein [Salinibacterium sp. G-O1]